MDLDGQSAYPSERTLAMESALSEKAVRSHLRIATAEGWISRKLWRERGKNWAGYRYSATLPSRSSAAERHSGATLHVPDLHAHGAESERALVRNNVPTNSTVNSTKNSIEMTPEQMQKRRQDIQHLMANVLHRNNDGLVTFK